MAVSSKYGLIDMTGKRIGRLLVLHREGTGKTAYWKCLCDCGNFAIVWGAALRAGTTKSCGCIHKEQLAERNKRNATHRMTKTREYAIWGGMYNRCFNSNTEQYEDYGGRGIRICEGWRSFENFFADMGKRPSREYSIDRINNNGHYSCGHCEECLANGWLMNCRWTDKFTQANNRRNTRILTHDGKTAPVMTWAREHRINRHTLEDRIERGWDIGRALTLLPQKYEKPIKPHGLSKTPEFRAWIAMRNVCKNTNDSRYENYGGRGIRICERWSSFENFYLDLAKRPSPKHGLSRKNNDGNYEPDNCIWATLVEISSNRKTMILSDWAKLYKIKKNTLRARLERGWSIEQSLYV